MITKDLALRQVGISGSHLRNKPQPHNQEIKPRIEPDFLKIEADLVD
jgi:hypothetical protein